MKASDLFKWTKKVDVMHFARHSDSTTLCGRPMLGNNYAVFEETADRPRCEKCVAVIDAEREAEKSKEVFCE